ncbi:MAG TPA: hypothetical protein VJU61_09785 [Polyangiaceae bacterium]|nr:hypothetical protein [Polyangiaceae bacterium]
MKQTSPSSALRLPHCLLATLALPLVGCGSGDASIVRPAPAEREGGALSGGMDPANSEASGAIMLAGQIYSPDAYNTYVGIFPEVPEGDVAFDTFREFGNANAYAHAGYVFVEEDGVMQRFSVNDSLELVSGPSFSWQDFGVSEINTTYTVFVSATRSYTFAPELGVVIVWNPETMERSGALELELPARPDGMETFAYDGYVVGDKVVWNVFSGNWDTVTPYPAVTLVIADAESEDVPVRVIEDDRCLPGGPSHVDQKGNYYVQAGAFYGYFLAYGDVGASARTCVLRMRAGEAEFDSEYLVDYQALTGSYVNDPWYNISDTQYFARSWDPTQPVPEDPDEFYDNPALRPLLVDIDAGTAAPYPDLANLKSIDGVTRRVDGTSYLQLSETGYVENGSTDVVELHPDGVVTKFHLNGFLLGLERVR